jgi:hypothetical protein
VYQVLITTTVPLSGQVDLTFVAVNGGKSTNPVVGTEFQKVDNFPPSAEPTANVLTAFTGGFDPETDAEYVVRLLDRIKRRPASGNNAQFRAWAREVSTAVETAFVYACAFNAGSTVVTILQKRGQSIGPLARVASAGLLAQARAYLTPPTSGVVPSRPFVLVTPINPDPISMALTLSMRKGSSAGWEDISPWPIPVDTASSITAFSRITAFTDSTHFKISSQALPNGATMLTAPDAPEMMVWDPATTRFERLDVLSVTFDSGNNFDVVLNEPPTTPIALNSAISPYTAQLDGLGKTIESYFDGLGPGEAVNLETDPRSGRAFRWPPPNDEYPSEAGQSVSSKIFEVLGTAVSGALVRFITHGVPPLPENFAEDGPNQLTIDDFGVYA